MPTIEANDRYLQNLKELSSKVLQAYRLRSQLFNKRYEILKSLNGNINNWNKQTELQLAQILKNEKNLLNIIESNESALLNNIGYAKQTATALKEGLTTNRKGKVYAEVDAMSTKSLELTGKGIMNFLNEMISFLEQSQNDLEVVKQRIAIEESFLESGSSDHFKDFIDAWEKECDANRVMAQHFARLLERSQKITRKLRKNQAFIALIGSVTGTFSGLILALAIPPAAIVAAASVVLGLGVMINDMSPFITGGVHKIDEEKSILKKTVKLLSKQ